MCVCVFCVCVRSTTTTTTTTTIEETQLFCLRSLTTPFYGFMVLCSLLSALQKPVSSSSSKQQFTTQSREPRDREKKRQACSATTMSADTDDDDDDDGSGDCANKEGQKKMNGLFSCFSCFAGHEKEDDAKNKSIRENNNGLEEISTLEDDEEENEKMNTDKTETYEENASRKDDANKNKNKRKNNAEKNKKTNNKNDNAEEIDRMQNSLSSNAGSSTSSSSSANNNNNTKIKAPPSGANRRLGSLKLTPSVQKLSIIMDDKEHEQLNQYIMIKDLGRGAHAKVKLGLNKMDNNLYALKIRNERVRVAEASSSGDFSSALHTVQDSHALQFVRNYCASLATSERKIIKGEQQRNLRHNGDGLKYVFIVPPYLDIYVFCVNSDCRGSEAVLLSV